MRRFKVVAAIAAASLVLTACGASNSGSGGGSGASSKVVDFKIAYGATSAADIPVRIAMDDGIFKKHGLNVSMVLLPGTKAPPALASQSVQLASSGVSDLAGAIVAGSPFTIVGTRYPWMFFQVYGQKGMKSLQDLKGKSIAASSPGSVSDTAINIAMKGSGLVRGKDYKVVYVGDNPARMAALEKGVVGAIVTSPPTAQLVAKKGYPDLNDMIKKKISYGYGAFGVNKNWASKNKETLIKFFQAYAEAIRLGRSDPEKAYAVEKKYLGLTDQSVIKAVYDVSAAIMPEYGRTEASMIQNTIKYSENPKVVDANPNTMFDNSYIDAAKTANK